MENEVKYTEKQIQIFRLAMLQGWSPQVASSKAGINSTLYNHYFKHDPAVSDLVQAYRDRKKRDMALRRRCH